MCVFVIVAVVGVSFILFLGTFWRGSVFFFVCCVVDLRADSFFRLNCAGRKNVELGDNREAKWTYDAYSGAEERKVSKWERAMSLIVFRGTQKPFVFRAE